MQEEKKFLSLHVSLLYYYSRVVVGFEPNPWTLEHFALSKAEWKIGLQMISGEQSDICWVHQERPGPGRGQLWHHPW